MTPTDLRIYNHIRRFGPRTPSELGQLLGRSTHNVTKSCARLVKQGLLYRVPIDSPYRSHVYGTTMESLAEFMPKGNES